MMLVYRFQLLEPMLFHITDAKDQHKQMSRCTHTETVGKKLSLSFGSSSTCSAEKTPSVIHPLMSILSSSYKNREKRKGGGGGTSFVHQSAPGCQGSTMIINHRVTKRGLFRVVRGDGTLRRSLMRQRQVETLLDWLCNQGKAAPLAFHPRAEMTAFRATDGNKLWNGYVMTVNGGRNVAVGQPQTLPLLVCHHQGLMSSAVLSSSTNVSLIRRRPGTGPAVRPR